VPGNRKALGPVGAEAACDIGDGGLDGGLTASVRPGGLPATTFAPISAMMRTRSKTGRSRFGRMAPATKLASFFWSAAPRRRDSTMPLSSLIVC